MLPCHQRGQALAEALMVLAALGCLWLAVAWLGRLQDIGLHLAHASRRLAFAHAHQGLAPQDLATDGPFQMGAAGPHWHNRQGQDLLPAGVQLDLGALARVPARQVGDPVAGAGELREQWQLGDPSVWRAGATAVTLGQSAPRGDLRDFDQLQLTLQRHTAILRGSGAATGDAQVQSTLGSSQRAWARWASASRAAGQRIQEGMQPVDAAWGRPGLTWNWIDPWAAWVPQTHLQNRRQP